MIAIDIKHLTLSYECRSIFQHFNAEIADGEFIGIFGPNGAGKSSLLRAILGLLTPSAGTINVLGQPAERGNSAIGYVAQSHTMQAAAQLSGRARVAAAYQGYRWGLPFISKTERQELTELLQLVDAQHFADRPFNTLSGGEKQRLFLAQALLNRPKILLLDEPLSNLDPGSQELLIALVQKIRTELNVTVLFTAHDLNPLLHVMDRIIYLAQGNAAIGSVTEIVTSEKLSWLYGIPIEVVRHNDRLFVVSHEHGTEYAALHHNHSDSV